MALPKATTGYVINLSSFSSDKPETNTKTKRRKCLMCGDHFDSAGSQFRRCGECKTRYATWITTSEDTPEDMFGIMYGGGSRTLSGSDTEVSAERSETVE